MMDAERFRHHTGKGREETLAHVEIPMMGGFKVETRIKNHLQAVVNNTD